MYETEVDSNFIQKPSMNSPIFIAPPAYEVDPSGVGAGPVSFLRSE